MQARHQACSPAQAPTGVRGYPQGGLLQIPYQPQEGPEARRQEVVLRAHQGVRLGLNSTTITATTTTKSHIDMGCVAEEMVILHCHLNNNTCNPSFHPESYFSFLILLSA